MVPHNGVINHDVVLLFLYCCPFFKSTGKSVLRKLGDWGQEKRDQMLRRGLNRMAGETYSLLLY